MYFISLALGLLAFVVLLLFNSKPAIQYHQKVVPTIYGITPTYARLAQKADLTRLSQTLMLVKKFHWIVIEDSENKTKLVENLLKESTLKYTHLNVKTKEIKGKGVEQRNLALDWLRKYLKTPEGAPGVVYFMDDDNTYSLKVFEEIRKVKRVGVWPVGIVGGMRVERPLVTDGKVSGFSALWKPYRPFALDMAGFAINASLFLDYPEAKFSWKIEAGFLESEILKYFVTVKDLEPLADNCTKVYVWHTRTQNMTRLDINILRHPPINDADIEV
ncbi:galactosylgalactosylxylosylprotein 3-beta-glucuronosyltransferase 3-like [Choristoneura fumiferana]|uniref:galactosylgalactosylxylosylprotein 3-beta-glucuronosyltransferase 3-like n=1 Tax=Choristoneura fumiferana TaxID=7141 RepID=UPI003D158033